MLLSLVTNVFSFPMLSRLDSEDDQEPGNLQHLHSKTDSPTPVEGHNNNNESTKTEEPNTSQLGPTECKHHKEETKSASTLNIFLFILRLPPFIVPVFSLHSGRQQSLECI